MNFIYTYFFPTKMFSNIISDAAIDSGGEYYPYHFLLNKNAIRFVHEDFGLNIEPDLTEIPKLLRKPFMATVKSRRKGEIERLISGSWMANQKYHGQLYYPHIPKELTNLCAVLGETLSKFEDNPNIGEEGADYIANNYELGDDNPLIPLFLTLATKITRRDYLINSGQYTKREVYNQNNLLFLAQLMEHNQPKDRTGLYHKVRSVVDRIRWHDNKFVLFDEIKVNQLIDDPHMTILNDVLKPGRVFYELSHTLFWESGKTLAEKYVTKKT